MYVLLGGGTPQANQTPNTSVPADQSELITSLQDQIRYLREQLDAEGGQNRRAPATRTVAAQLTRRSRL